MACERDAKEVAEAGKKQEAPGFHRLEWKARREVHKRRVWGKRGRPPRGARVPVRQTTVWKVQGKIKRDRRAWQQRQECCGMFVLITSLKDQEQYSAKDLLATYKGQQTAERLLVFLKDPTVVGAYCLKSPARILAFGYVVLMAALVYTLLERQVRKALAKPREQPVAGVNRRPTKRPTS